MRIPQFKKLLSQADSLTAGQRQQLLAALQASQSHSDASEAIGQRPAACPHCNDSRLMRNGQASGLQRYKCRGCGRTFNALSGTPLAHLRHKAKWAQQADVLRQGLSVHQAAAAFGVAASTAFRWRHRFLKLPSELKPAKVQGIAEADETFFLRSVKGQKVQGRKARRRGGLRNKRGTGEDYDPVLVVRDRSGSTTDFILQRANKAQTQAALAPLLPADVVLCTDAGGALSEAARQLGVEHHALNQTWERRVQGPWHIQNVNAYHSRLKGWVRRFKGVASLYLANYLGWFRALDRGAMPREQPAAVLRMALGRSTYP
ncbi:IS1595 family transposase [Paracidovorax citrulli]